MTSLFFTAGGATSAPDTLQIRVTRHFTGRVAAGAPHPSRTLDVEELRANVRFFTRAGPRTVPVTGIVLSGLGLGRDAVPPTSEVAAILDEARASGVTRVTLHLARGAREALAQGPLARRVDAVALNIAIDEDLADVAALLGAGVHVTAVVVLDEGNLARLDHLADGLADARPDRVVLTWPLDSTELPPHAERVAALLPGPVARLDAAGIPTGIKGLPACHLGPLAARLWRSGNRWYVDADHQQQGALLFFPGVVRFLHPDECRFCALADRCDGVPAVWWEQGLCGVLRAFAQ